MQNRSGHIGSRSIIVDQNWCALDGRDWSSWKHNLNNSAKFAIWYQMCIRAALNQFVVGKGRRTIVFCRHLCTYFSRVFFLTLAYPLLHSNLLPIFFWVNFKLYTKFSAAVRRCSMFNFQKPVWGVIPLE